MSPSRRRLRLAAILLALGAGTGSGPLRAEVSVLAGDQGEYRGTLIMYREGSPPTQVWTKIRPIDDRFVLNPQGDTWGDGFPDIALDPVTHLPQVVWAQHSGTASDIVLAHWDGAQWTSPALAAGALSPTDLPFSRDSALRLSPVPGALIQPRLAIGDNRMTHVVWGSNETTPSVWCRELNLAAGEIGDPQQLNDPTVPTQDPTILVGFDQVFIGVEQREADLNLIVVIQGTDIAAVSQRDSEPFRRRVVTVTLSVGRSGLTLDVQAGTARARWQESAAVLGLSSYLQSIDTWSSPIYVSTGVSGPAAP